MARKLPQPITREEFDQLLKVAKTERETYRRPRKKDLRPRGQRINQYMIAMILGTQAGLRISEIIGLRPEVSRCCKASLTEKIIKNSQGNKVKIKYCDSCRKGWKAHQVLRGNTGWDIEPLSSDKFKQDRIFISQGKGEKDRFVWRPRSISQKIISLFPLQISRRSLQEYITELGQRVLNKHITFHSLRHTFATEYLKKHPADIKTLQILMGHSRLDTTAVYTHVSIDDALKKAEEVF